MDGEPGRGLGAVLAGNDHPLLLELDRRLLSHDGELGPAAEEREVTALELADRAAGDQVDESPPLQLPQAVRRPQTANSGAKRRDIRGFMRWPTHSEPQNGPIRPLFAKN